MSFDEDRFFALRQAKLGWLNDLGPGLDEVRRLPWALLERTIPARRHAIIALIFVNAMWGSSFPVMKCLNLQVDQQFTVPLVAGGTLVLLANVLALWPEPLGHHANAGGEENH